MEQTESFCEKETSKIIHMSILIILIAFNELISSFNMQSQEKKQIFILLKNTTVCFEIIKQYCNN